MSITMKCDCGNTYELKDEFARQNVKCPNCGTVKRVPVAVVIDPAFAHDKFLLHQKAMAINAKYYVWDEAGRTLLFVERPSYVFRGILALGAGIVAALVTGAVLMAAAMALGESVLASILALLAFLGGFAALLVTAIALSPKRHVTFYRDDSKREKLLEVLQDHKLQIGIATYTVRDHRELIVARFRKNYLYNLVRKRWDCFAPNGTLLAVAKEDSIILSLLRRLLGPLFGLLRTNFIILQGASDAVAGEFNRKMTLLDRYVLDMAQDPNRRLDRRMMLALGVMLDTGERR